MGNICEDMDNDNMDNMDTVNKNNSQISFNSQKANLNFVPKFNKIWNLLYLFIYAE